VVVSALVFVAEAIYCMLLYVNASPAGVAVSSPAGVVVYPVDGPVELS